VRKCLEKGKKVLRGDILEMKSYETDTGTWICSVEMLCGHTATSSGGRGPEPLRLSALSGDPESGDTLGGYGTSARG